MRLKHPRKKCIIIELSEQFCIEFHHISYQETTHKTNSKTNNNNTNNNNTNNNKTNNNNNTNNKTNPKPADHSHGAKDPAPKKHSGTRGEFNNVSPLPGIGKNDTNRSSTPVGRNGFDSPTQKEKDLVSLKKCTYMYFQIVHCLCKDG